jgi:uncharacterized membrane-anchored protein YhcB (DUF1043 family)
MISLCPNEEVKNQMKAEMTEAQSQRDAIRNRIVSEFNKLFAICEELAEVNVYQHGDVMRLKNRAKLELEGRE